MDIFFMKKNPKWALDKMNALYDEQIELCIAHRDAIFHTRKGKAFKRYNEINKFISEMENEDLFIYNDAFFLLAQFDYREGDNYKTISKEQVSRFLDKLKETKFMQYKDGFDEFVSANLLCYSDKFWYDITPDDNEFMDYIKKVEKDFTKLYNEFDWENDVLLMWVTNIVS